MSFGVLQVLFTGNDMRCAGEDAGLLGHDVLPVQLLQVVLWGQQHRCRLVWLLLMAHFWHGGPELPMEL